MTFVKTNNPFGKSIDGLMNEIFNELPQTLGKTVREDIFNFPPVNIVERNDHYHLEVAAPGFDKADFNVKLEGNILTINAEKKAEEKVETDKVVRKEFSTKSFKRTFTLDDKIDASKINARYENGILNLDLAKKAEVVPATQTITIQ